MTKKHLSNFGLFLFVSTIFVELRLMVFPVGVGYPSPGQPYVRTERKQRLVSGLLFVFFVEIIFR